MPVDHPDDSCVDEQARADDARAVGDVHRRAKDGHAHARRLDERVLLGVDRVADLRPRAGRDVQLAAQALPPLLAGKDALGRAVVARGQDPLVPHDDRADLPVLLITRGPARDCVRHFHKPMVPLGECHALALHTLACPRFSYIIIPGVQECQFASRPEDEMRRISPN